MGSLLVCLSKDRKDKKTIEEFEKLFTMGSILGIGKFSEVKQARFDNKEIAVKCINIFQMKDDIKHLKREMKILKKIRHPNIIEFYEIYESKDNIYITMEICRNGSLKERVNRDGPVPIHELKIIAGKLLSALKYLHSQGICHRDLKPDNILFTEKDVKIADFGLARFMNGTNTYSMVGTPYYLSPEVISGDYNLKCDI